MKDLQRKKQLEDQAQKKKKEEEWAAMTPEERAIAKRAEQEKEA